EKFHASGIGWPRTPSRGLAKASAKASRSFADRSGEGRCGETTVRYTLTLPSPASKTANVVIGCWPAAAPATSSPDSKDRKQRMRRVQPEGGRHRTWRQNAKL